MEEQHCKECLHFLTFIDTTEASIVIDEIIAGKSEREKDSVCTHPITITKEKEKELNEKAFIAKLTQAITGDSGYLPTELLIYTKYTNEDYLSQCISLSSRWQSIMHTHIANMIGGMYSSGALFLCQDIFGCPAKELTIYQLKLLDATFRFISFSDQYHVKTLCKQCFEMDKIDTFLKHRQKVCHISKSHIVNTVEARIIRYYYSHDEDEKQFVNSEDFKILSLTEYFTEQFRDINEAKRRVKKNLPKSK
jgi:hypothetical protein